MGGGNGSGGQRELHNTIMINYYQCIPKYLILFSWEEPLLELGGGQWVMELGQ